MAIFSGSNAVSCRQAKAYMVIGSETVELFYAKSLKANYKKQKKEIRALGNAMTAFKSAGGTGSGTLVIYEVTSRFKQMFVDYIKTGKDAYFNLHIINEDVTANNGRESKVLVNCNFDEITVASFDTSDDVLEQTLQFTFEGIELLDKFVE